MGDEAAFPNQLNGTASDTGLTKREYFAGLAMQGLIVGCYSGNNVGFTVQGNVVAAVEYADALLTALTKPEREG